jgi:sugar phosphate isomerase/epimerase
MNRFRRWEKFMRQEDNTISGFILGCQAWTFNRFTVYEAVEKTAQAGGKYIEFFPGQRLSAGSSRGIGPDMTDNELQTLLSHCQTHKITPINFGVTGTSREVIQFAKRLGVPCVTTETNEKDIVGLEALVKEFDIKIAIHNHPRQPNNANYKVWDPKFVAKILQGRDLRLGACADTGHWPRSGIKGIDGLKTLKGRVLSTHFKDVNVISPSATDVPYGTGVNQVSEMLNELRKQKFTGNISIEYEANWDNNVLDAAQCIGFVRGWGSKK